MYIKTFDVFPIEGNDDISVEISVSVQHLPSGDAVCDPREIDQRITEMWIAAGEDIGNAEEVVDGCWTVVSKSIQRDRVIESITLYHPEGTLTRTKDK